MATAQMIIPQPQILNKFPLDSACCGNILPDLTLLSKKAGPLQTNQIPAAIINNLSNQNPII